MTRIEVVFCGSSVYLSGLAASLRRNRQLRIVEIDAGLDKAVNDLKILRPQVVVGEFAGSGPLDAIGRECPGLTLIAVDAATDTLTLFTGRQKVTAPVRDLERLIVNYPG